jgi:BirA family transcriptional regulator, biotin operon repressor / biotin---[acetyl-CoA-carboxylase] ligase
MRPEISAPAQAILGHPRVHLRSTTSTNDRARDLAFADAPHGTLVTAAEQTAGRGRMGRSWKAPPGSSLLMSLVLRIDSPSDAPPTPERLPVPLPLLAAVAVCDVAGEQARVKWPNDIVVQDGPALRKLAGILTEGRPQEGWAVLGIGLNVAVRLQDLPSELQASAATLGLPPEAIEATLASLLEALERRLADPIDATLDSWRELDILRGREVSWMDDSRHEQGTAQGIDDTGRLIVTTADGLRETLAAGEVHLRDAQSAQPAA